MPTWCPVAGASMLSTTQDVPVRSFRLFRGTMTMADDLVYALDRAIEYAEMGDLVMSRAMQACAERLMTQLRMRGRCL